MRESNQCPKSFGHLDASSQQGQEGKTQDAQRSTDANGTVAQIIVASTIITLDVTNLGLLALVLVDEGGSDSLEASLAVSGWSVGSQLLASQICRAFNLLRILAAFLI